MNKFNIDKFNSKKNYVIEASAGTGKTYNIVEIVKKLVNEENEDLNEILIVTYTEKAAGELKDRIRKGLNNKNIDVDNAPIYTIHSFCQNSIKEFGLSADLPMHLNVIDENEVMVFSEEYIRKGEILNDISNFYKYTSINTDSIIGVLTESLKKYYLTREGNEDISIVSLEKYDHNLYLSLSLDIYRGCSFCDILNNYPTIKENFDIISNSSDLEMNNFAEDIRNNYINQFNYSGSFKESTFKMATNLELQAFKYFKYIKELLKVNVSKIFGSKYLKDFYLKWQAEKGLNKSQTFDDMIRYVRETILTNTAFKSNLQKKYKRAIIDEFQDTNQKQFDIFKSIFMSDDDHRIIVVGDPKQSIYSFQGADVNVYLDAVKAIVNGGGEFCVLNKNYRSTKGMVSSCNKLFQNYNFNGIKFNDTEYLNLDEDEDVHDVKYNNCDVNAFWVATSENHKTIEEKDFPKIAVQKIIDCCTADSEGKTKLQIKHKGGEFKNVSFKDFAILVRTSSEISLMEKALKNAGIPYLRYKDKKLFLGKECADYIAVLKALVTPDYTGYNRKILKKAMFTSFFGYSLEVINSDYFNIDDREEIYIINEWKRMTALRYWEDLFDSIIIDSKLTENLKTLKEIQSLAIYKQIGDYCIEYVSKGKSLEELIRNLSNLSKNDNSDADNEDGKIIEKSTNFDCVQIMTMHASKGLQFPVVISVGGYNKPYTHGKAYNYHVYDDVDKKSKQILTFDRNDIVKDEEIAEWKRLFYVAYTRAEFILMLPYYKKFGTDNGCSLSTYKNEKWSKVGTKAYKAQVKKYDNNFLRLSLERYIDNYPNDFDYIIDDNTTYAKLRKESKKILGSREFDEKSKDKQVSILKEIIKEGYQRKTTKHSYSSLSHDKVIIDELIDPELENKEGLIEEGLSMFDKFNKVVPAMYDETVDPIMIPGNYPRGAKLGTALHEVFEGLDFTNYQENLDARIAKRFNKVGISPKEEWIEATKDIVTNVLEATLPIINGSRVIDGSFTLSSIPFEDKLDEVEFNFNILNEKLKDYCNGFVDMIFKRGEYYSIVDWKSDKLNDIFDSYSNTVSLSGHVNDSYSIQRVLYSYCLIKWLKISMPNETCQSIFEKHFGGVYYVFLRGCNSGVGNGVYAQTWDSWDELEKSYNHIIKVKIGGRK